MTRATRFASYASVIAFCYFLAWFSILPAPFIAEETKDQILPVVRASRPVIMDIVGLWTRRWFVAPVVGAGILWVLFAGIARVGVMVVQGLS